MHVSDKFLADLAQSGTLVHSLNADCTLALPSLLMGLCFQIMAQAERLSQLAAERQELVEAGVSSSDMSDMSGTMLGMQDQHAALSDAIVDAEARISDVMRQKEESQVSRGEMVLQHGQH